MISVFDRENFKLKLGNQKRFAAGLESIYTMYRMGDLITLSNYNTRAELTIPTLTTNKCSEYRE